MLYVDIDDIKNKALSLYPGISRLNLIFQRANRFIFTCFSLEFLRLRNQWHVKLEKNWHEIP